MSVSFRGVMKHGRIELLEEVRIEEGSLLEIRVFKTGSQVRIEKQAQKRVEIESGLLRFGFGKTRMTGDPLIAFQRLPKTISPTMRFDAYETTIICGLIAEDVLSELVQYAMRLGESPDSVTKRLRSMMRRRKQLSLSGGSEEARRQGRELMNEFEKIAEDDYQLALWEAAALAVTGDAQYVSHGLELLPKIAAEFDVDRSIEESVGGHEIHDRREESILRHQNALRRMLLELLVARVKSWRRTQSGSSESVRLAKAELKEIAERLVAMRDQLLP